MKLHTVRFCDLCRRQTFHTSINRGIYKCDICNSGVRFMPVDCPAVYIEW